MTSTFPKLDLGCGKNKQPGALGVDVTRYEGQTDLLCDVTHLPFRDNSFDSVVGFDVIEHFPTWQVPEVLAEWIRVSKDRLTLKTPNLRTLAQAYLAGTIPVTEFARKVYGGGSLDKNPYNLHKSGMDESSTKLLLSNYPVYGIQIVPSLPGGDWSNLSVTFRKQQSGKK